MLGVEPMVADSPRPGITPTKIPRAPPKTSVQRQTPGEPPPLARHKLIPYYEPLPDKPKKGRAGRARKPAVRQPK